VAVFPAESVTVALKVEAPRVLGVPVIAPVEVLRVKPAGREPLMLNVYGGVPPPAVSADEYATPTCPVLAGQVKVNCAGAMVMLQLMVTVATPLESVTVAEKLDVPAVVGVPVMAPVEVLRVKPAGNDPLLMLNV